MSEELNLTTIRAEAENAMAIVEMPKATIIAMCDRIKELEASGWCPCSGRFEGVGYYKGDTVYQCEKCGLQITVTKEALKGNSNGK